MLKAIFFDLDGTLCRFHGDFKEIFSRACEGICAFDSYDEIAALWSQLLSQEGALTAASALAKIGQELHVGEAPYPAMAQLLCESYAQYIAPFEGSKELLATLAQTYQLGLITNGPLDMQNAAIDSLGIRDFFKTIIISGDPSVGFRKPNPLIFQMALQRVGVEGSDALMIGDNVKVDIEGAKSAGLHTLFVGPTNDGSVNPRDLRSLLDKITMDL